MRQDGPLVGGAERPAGRIVRRIDVDRARRRSQRVQQSVDVERPTGVPERQFDAGDLRPQDLRNLDEVGPERRDRHDTVARPDQRLCGQHQRRHARARDHDAVELDWAVQAADVGGDCLPQLGDAEIVGIEGRAGIQGIDPRLPDECRCDLVGLAEPERQHVPAPHARVGDLADLRSAQAANGFACDWKQLSHDAQFTPGLGMSSSRTAWTIARRVMRLVMDHPGVALVARVTPAVRAFSTARLPSAGSAFAPV